MKKYDSELKDILAALLHIYKDKTYGDNVWRLMVEEKAEKLLTKINKDTTGETTYFELFKFFSYHPKISLSDSEIRDIINEVTDFNSNNFWEEEYEKLRREFAELQGDELILIGKIKQLESDIENLTMK